MSLLLLKCSHLIDFQSLFFVFPLQLLYSVPDPVLPKLIQFTCIKSVVSIVRLFALLFQARLELVMAPPSLNSLQCLRNQSQSPQQLQLHQKQVIRSTICTLSSHAFTKTGSLTSCIYENQITYIFTYFQSSLTSFMIQKRQGAALMRRRRNPLLMKNWGSGSKRL